MGTMLQGYDLTMEDFQQLDGCNEILNVTRPRHPGPVRPGADGRLAGAD